MNDAPRTPRIPYTDDELTVLVTSSLLRAAGVRPDWDTFALRYEPISNHMFWRTAACIVIDDLKVNGVL